MKFFADDTSLFSIVTDPQTTALNMNRDLSTISDWAYQWKMRFNPDPNKPAEEILFSQKTHSPYHPPLYFNGAGVKRVNYHKHLGLTLDNKLNFVRHIRDKISTAKKWIGLIKHLSTYIPPKCLDQIYKMQIRPHLDYCDIIFHSSLIDHDDSTFSLKYQLEALERTQYQAALAVTGTWRGTNTDKIYEEIGWESLHSRRYIRRLIMLYKIVKLLFT